MVQIGEREMKHQSKQGAGSVLWAEKLMDAFVIALIVVPVAAAVVTAFM